MTAHSPRFSNSTVFRWLCEARNADAEGKSDTLAQQFRDSLKKARAEAIYRAIVIIGTAAKDHWQAAAWWLERSYPQEFGRARLQHRR